MQLLEESIVTAMGHRPLFLSPELSARVQQVRNSLSAHAIEALYRVASEAMPLQLIGQLTVSGIEAEIWWPVSLKVKGAIGLPCCAVVRWQDDKGQKGIVAGRIARALLPEMIEGEPRLLVMMEGQIGFLPKDKPFSWPVRFEKSDDPFTAAKRTVVNERKAWLESLAKRADLVRSLFR
ncbi:MAG: hypothetical protein AB7U41_05655 [Dongiaceae bacterium]